MSDEVLRSLIRKYLRLHLPQSVFCWQGGEPTLMGLDFFQHAVLLMQQCGTRGQSVSNALQTNGLLLNADWCRFLRQYRFLVGLSLDGPAEYHDAFRKYPGGKGSHADVLRVFHLLREQQVEFNVLAVVTSLTAGHAKEVYRYFRDLGLMHMQFIPCVETDQHTGEVADFSVGPGAYGDFLCELFDAWLPEAKECVSIRLFDGLLRRELQGNTGLCYLDGNCGHCPVVEHNGDVYPCDFFVQPEWKLGNITSSPVEKLLDRSRARAFRKARLKMPEACSDCEWAQLCRGGCLKDRRRISGRFDVPTYFCEAYRRLFAHASEPLKKLAADVRADNREGPTHCSPASP